MAPRRALSFKQNRPRPTPTDVRSRIYGAMSKGYVDSPAHQNSSRNAPAGLKISSIREE